MHKECKEERSATPAFLSEQVKKEGVILLLYIQPRASKSELIGEHDGRLKLKLCSPPVDNAANSECIRFFAKLLHIPKTSLNIIQGETSRRKSLLIKGVSFHDLAEQLEAYRQ